MTTLDPQIPFLAATLDRHQAQQYLKTLFPHLQAVTTATLVRHKLGRRALVEYHLATRDGPLILMGKVRAKGLDWRSYQIQKTLWSQGWAMDSPDGFSVPEPLGVIPPWQMWLQRKVPGLAATAILPTETGISLTRRIAALAHKFHHTRLIPPKIHTLRDEIRILHNGLTLVVDQYPQWRSRLEGVLQTCTHLATQVPTVTPTPIHRDFYGDQILVDGDRLWLLDFDLCCQGDPALDIGNFIAHITEQSLRDTGDARTMERQETALREAFIQGWQPLESQQSALPLDPLRRVIERYTVLSLVRHIYISTRIPARRPFTARLLRLCEARLSGGYEGHLRQD